MSIQRVAIIGLGLLGGSLGLALKEYRPEIATTGYDADLETKRRASERGLVAAVQDQQHAEHDDADLVVLCVPVGAMGAVACEIADALSAHAIVSDVGSSKASIHKAISEALPNHCVIPAHPVAGTEQSGPDAGFATLFQHRWCILTPTDDAPEQAVAELRALWEALGAQVEIMSAEHHDLVLAVTSHLPHLIAYTIVGTASDLEDVTRSEVIKYSAGGFRDFTRIAASDPTMWRDVFLSNKDAVLEMLQVFSEDLTRLQRAIRRDDGDALFELFSKTRAIRRGIIEMGQDDARPDFGRSDHEG